MQIKAHMSACRAAIPRPPWEPPCRRVIVIMMAVLLLGILLMGYIEANYMIEPWASTKSAELFIF